MASKCCSGPNRARHMSVTSQLPPRPLPRLRCHLKTKNPDSMSMFPIWRATDEINHESSLSVDRHSSISPLSCATVSRQNQFWLCFVCLRPLHSLFFHAANRRPIVAISLCERLVAFAPLKHCKRCMSVSRHREASRMCCQFV